MGDMMKPKTRTMAVDNSSVHGDFSSIGSKITAPKVEAKAKSTQKFDRKNKIK
jgi:hypothetical protein